MESTIIDTTHSANNGQLQNYQFIPLPVQFNESWLERTPEAVIKQVNALYKEAIDHGCQSHTPLFYAGAESLVIEPTGWIELTTGLNLQFPDTGAIGLQPIRDEYIGLITTAAEQAKSGLSVLGGLHYVMRTNPGELVVPVYNVNALRPLTVKPGDVIGQLTMMSYLRTQLQFRPRTTPAVNDAE